MDIQFIISVGLVISMIYTGVVWLLTRNQKIRMDSSIIAYTLILWGVLYGVSLFTSIDREELSNISRVGFIMICLSQSVPLTVSYFRSIKRAKQ